jgi:hypothetical protein
MFVPDGYEILGQQALWNGCWKLSVRRIASGENAVAFFFPVDAPYAGDLEKLYHLNFAQNSLSAACAVKIFSSTFKR